MEETVDFHYPFSQMQCVFCCLQQTAVNFIIDYNFVLRKNASLE